jgi:hypothetical protein
MQEQNPRTDPAFDIDYFPSFGRHREPFNYPSDLSLDTTFGSSARKADAKGVFRDSEAQLPAEYERVLADTKTSGSITINERHGTWARERNTATITYPATADATERTEVVTRNDTDKSTHILTTDAARQEKLHVKEFFHSDDGERLNVDRSRHETTRQYDSHGMLTHRTVTIIEQDAPEAPFLRVGSSTVTEDFKQGVPVLFTYHRNASIPSGDLTIVNDVTEYFNDQGRMKKKVLDITDTDTSSAPFETSNRTDTLHAERTRNGNGTYSWDVTRNRVYTSSAGDDDRWQENISVKERNGKIEDGGIRLGVDEKGNSYTDRYKGGKWVSEDSQSRNAGPALPGMSNDALQAAVAACSATGTQGSMQGCVEHTSQAATTPLTSSNTDKSQNLSRQA